jgi:glycosyltransferase involved in cell wall biosynthesis
LRVLYLTGGAGRMYCGSCLRDNAMATELIARGHDVLLLPVYTPTFTDEPNVSNGHVVLGGISAYLEQYVPLFRKTPRWLDRLWDSKTVLSLASRRSLSTDPKMLGEMTVSVLKGEAGFQRKEIDKFVDWAKDQAPPDVVNLPYTLLLSLAEPLKQALNVPILCTLQGEDLFLDGLQEPYRTESMNLIRDQLRHVDLFLSVSEYYADFMPGYLGIPREKIRVVPLGINPHGFELRERNRGGPFRIGKRTARPRRVVSHPAAIRRSACRQTGSGGLHGCRLQTISRRASAAFAKRRPRRRVPISRCHRSRREDRVFATSRRDVVAGNLRRTERSFTTRSDGLWRAAGPASPRWIHGDRRKDGRRSAGPT